MEGNILTNDPSFTHWGYAVIDDKNQVIDSGCIMTSAQSNKRRIRVGDDNVRRTNEIVYRLKQLIDRYKVMYILTELPHGSQNAKASQMVGRVEGVLETISVFTGIGVEWYSEGDVKKHLFGKQKVTKEQMQEEIKRVFGGKMQGWTGKSTKDEHIADALGVYLTAKEQSATLKLVRNA